VCVCVCGGRSNNITRKDESHKLRTINSMLLWCTSHISYIHRLPTASFAFTLLLV